MLRKLTTALIAVAFVLSASPAHAATVPPPGAVAASVSSTLASPAAFPLVTATAPPSTVASSSSYTVVSGDTLSRIAQRFCGHASAFPALARASGIANPDRIWPGQRVVLACSGGTASRSVVTASTVSAPASGSAARVIAYAMAQIGKPYVYGAAGPYGFDCSGLIVAAYRSIGINLPHFTGDLLGHGTAVSRANLRPGDLVFLSYGHVGLAIGGDKVVVAPHTGDHVKVQSIYAYYAGRRLL